MSEGDDPKPEEEAPPKDGAKTEAEGEAENPSDGADGEGEDAPKAGLKAKLMGMVMGHLKQIIIAAVALVVFGGGGAGIYFSGILHTAKPHTVSVGLPEPLVYHEIPRVTVDLKPTANRKRPFIRMTLQAELQGESARAAFIAKEAKIMDTINTHLRETTAEDLQGKSGTEQLREDITIIINRIIAPEVAVTVLYKDILIR